MSAGYWHNLFFTRTWLSVDVRLQKGSWAGHPRGQPGCCRASPELKRALFPDSGGRCSVEAQAACPRPVSSAPGLSLREPAAAPRALPPPPPLPAGTPAPCQSGLGGGAPAAPRPYQWAGRLNARPPLPRRSSPAARRGLGGPAMAPRDAAAGPGAGPRGRR